VLKTAQRYASRVEQANIVLLLADGGWKYLSSDLWNADYSDLPEDIDAKVWW
jgi:cysteine synthase B